jgi:Acetoacetate decarboxylase (ADC)
VLQSNAELPEVPAVPAPWTLRGHGWMVALRLGTDDPARSAFLPKELQSTLRAAVSVLMCVVYDEAPCGPYRELLFVPGTLQVGMARHPSISRILVSTWDSVVNGRRNWGIPKDRADFDWTRDEEADRWRVSDRGRQVCQLEFSAPTGIRLPLSTRWLPRRWGTLVQRLDGRTWLCRPQATGSLQLCRVRHWQFDPALFPDLARATVLAAARVHDFRMTFPVAVTQP